MNTIKDSRISSITKLDTPYDIKNELTIEDSIVKSVINDRRQIENIIDNSDSRILVIMGPCSIHDTEAALEYANFVKKMKDEFKDELFIVMRTYFSKPRTTIGWKGLVYDPDLDNTFNIKKGLRISRKVLIDILNKGVPCSMEHLDTIIPQYFDNLLCWAAIGARTTESQIHRELASGCSSPIGFKNGTGGSIDLAVNAVESSNKAHHFLGCDGKGDICNISTNGNPYSHIILRGGSKGPNFTKPYVSETIEKLKTRNLKTAIIIDCSHGNSEKIHKNQINVADNVAEQISEGNRSIKGIMLESNLTEGNQSINDKPLIYGKSITDACIHLNDTYIVLKKLQKAKLIRDSIFK